MLRNDLRVIDIRKGTAHDPGIVVHPVIQLTAADGNAYHALVLIYRLSTVRELALLKHLKIPVRAKLCVHAEILEVGLCYKFTQRVRHAADAELHGRTVNDVRQNVRRNTLILLGGSGIFHLIQRQVIAFDDVIDLGNVDGLVEAAEYAGHVLVDLDNDYLALVGDAF